MNRTWFLLAALAVAGCGSPTPGPGSAPGAEPVQLMLNWYPEAEHGGFYSALVEHFYTAEGLAVEILKGGPGAPVIQQVATGRVAFGVTNADTLLLGRAQGAGAVAVMAPIQVSPRCILVHEGSGIRRFEELKDLTLAVSNAQPFFHWLRKKVPLAGVTVVPYPGNVAQFLVDKKYAQQGYTFSEPYVAKRQGGDPHSLLVAELGYNPYTSVLVVGAELIRTRPELVRRMVRASVRGWEHYLAAPESAHRHIHGIHPEMSLEALDFGARELVALVRDPVAMREGVGAMSRERWQTLGAQLVEAGSLEAGGVDATTAFDSSFLPPPP